MQPFGGDEQFPKVLLGPFLVDHVYFLHYPRIEYPEVAADVFFADSRVRADDVVVTKDGVPDLGPRFYDVTVSDLRVKDIAFDSEHVIAADPHDVVFLRGGLEHDDGPLLDDVEVAEDDFEVLIFFFADDGARGVDDASFAEDDVANDFIEAKV